MNVRFGKKIELPSTASIKHELRLMGAIDDLIDGGILRGPALSEGAERETLAADVARRNGISVDRAGMLVDRFSDNRHTLEVAARTLATRPTHGAGDDQ